MAHLTCVRHNRRVMVFDMGELLPGLRAVSVVHRDSGKVNDRCDSAALTIDTEVFSPREIIDWGTEDYVPNYIQGVYDAHKAGTVLTTANNGSK